MQSDTACERIAALRHFIFFRWAASLAPVNESLTARLL
jgi:hypothetical protein